jgi:hypothetical protein
MSCRDLRFESDPARDPRDAAFGAVLVPEREVLLLPACLVDALHARFIGSAAALINFALLHPDNLASMLNLTVDEVRAKLEALVKLLRGHVPDEMLQLPRLFEVKFIEDAPPHPRGVE